MEKQTAEPGLRKFKRLIREKNSHLILGLDPTAEEFDRAIKEGTDIVGHFKGIIDQTAEHIVGIKPNLAFYEHSEASRRAMAELMRYAKQKGLATMMDAKRGDIMDTQTQMAKADKKNFNPDVSTLHGYSGKDAVEPYLNEGIDTIIMAAMSNPNAQLQNRRSEGLSIYQHMALDAHRMHPSRVGFVVGATQTEAIKAIRMAEKEYGYEPGMVLAPGFGKQGGNLEFCRYAGKNALYPISSGLTKEKHLNGKTPGQAAKEWKEKINEQIAMSREAPSLTEHTTDGLIKHKFIRFNTETEPSKKFLLKKGRDKISAAGLILPPNKDEMIEMLAKCLKDGIIQHDADNVFGNDVTNFFANFRDVMGMDDQAFSHNMGLLMTERVRREEKKTGEKFDCINIVPWGALDMGFQVGNNMRLPKMVLRDQAKVTHDRVVGGLQDGRRIATIEDVATSASSGINNIELVRQIAKERNINVTANDLFVFFERPEDNPHGNCSAKNIKLHSQIDFDYFKHIIAKSPNVDKRVKDIIK